MAEKQVAPPAPKPPATEAPAKAPSTAAPGISSAAELGPESAFGLSMSSFGMADVRALMGQGSADAGTPPTGDQRVAQILAMPPDKQVDEVAKLVADGWISSASPADVRLAQAVFARMAPGAKTLLAQRDGGTLAESLLSHGATVNAPKAPSWAESAAAAWNDRGSLVERAKSGASTAYDTARGASRKGASIDLNGAQRAAGGSLGGIQLDEKRSNVLQVGGDAADGRAEAMIPRLDIKSIAIPTESGLVLAGSGVVQTVRFMTDQGADNQTEFGVGALRLNNIAVFLGSMIVMLPTLALLGLNLKTDEKKDGDLKKLVQEKLDAVARGFLRDTAGLADQVAAGNSDPSALTKRLGVAASGMSDFHMTIAKIDLPGGVKCVNKDGSANSLESLSVSDVSVDLEQHDTLQLLQQEVEQLRTKEPKTAAEAERFEWVSDRVTYLDDLRTDCKQFQSKLDRGQTLSSKERDKLTEWQQSKTTGVLKVGVGAIDAKGIAQHSSANGVTTDSKVDESRMDGIESTMIDPSLGMTTKAGTTSQQRLDALEEQRRDQALEGNESAQKAFESVEATRRAMKYDGSSTATTVGSVHSTGVDTKTTDALHGTSSSTHVAGADATGVSMLQVHNETDVHADTGSASRLLLGANDSGKLYGDKDTSSTSVRSASADDVDASLHYDPLTHATKTTGTVGSARAAGIATSDVHQVTGSKATTLTSSTTVGQVDAHGIAFGMDAVETKAGGTTRGASSFGATLRGAHASDVTQTSSDSTANTSSTVHVDDARAHDVRASGASRTVEGADGRASTASTFAADVGSVAATGVDYQAVDGAAGTVTAAHLDSADASGIHASGGGTTRGYETTDSSLDAHVDHAGGKGITYSDADTSAYIGDAEAQGIDVAQDDSGTVATLDGATAHDLSGRYGDDYVLEGLDAVSVGRSGVALDGEGNLEGASVDGLDVEGIDIDILRMDLDAKETEEEKAASAKATSDREAKTGGPDAFHADAMACANGSVHVEIPVAGYSLSKVTLDVPVRDGLINVDDIALSALPGKGPSIAGLLPGAVDLIHVEPGRGLVLVTGGVRMFLLMDTLDYEGLETGKQAGNKRGAIALQPFLEAMQSGRSARAELTDEAVAALKAKLAGGEERREQRRAERAMDKDDRRELRRAERDLKVHKKDGRNNLERAEDESEDAGIGEDSTTQDQIDYWSAYLATESVDINGISVDSRFDVGDGDLGFDSAGAHLTGGKGVNEFVIHGTLGESLSIGANEIAADQLTAETEGGLADVTDLGVRGLAVTITRPLATDRKIAVHVDGATVKHVDYGDTSRLS